MVEWLVFAVVACYATLLTPLTISFLPGVHYSLPGRSTSGTIYYIQFKDFGRSGRLVASIQGLGIDGCLEFPEVNKP
jgi:hypothetical protein